MSYGSKKIVLRDAETVYPIAVENIIRCESNTNYTQFFLTDERTLIVSKTLKEYEYLLSNQSFLRVHRSHLINLHHFDRFEKKEGGIIYMNDGSSLPVSVRKKEILISALEKL